MNFTLEYPLGAESRENLRIDASARDFSFDEILHSSADSLEMEEKSALSGTLHFSGPRENPLAGEGAISIDDFRFAAGNLVIRQGGNLQAVINKGRLQFTNVKFLVEDKELALTGYVDRESGWMGNLSGNWNLNALVTNLPSLEQATGEIAMQLDIRGPIFAPVLSGPLDLRRASISMPLASTIVGLSEGEAETFFQNGNLEIKSIRGRIGGSFVEASGRIKDVADPSKRDVFLELNLPGVVLEVIENLTTEIMGNLTFRKSPGTAFLIGGELQIKRALYEDTVSLIELIKAISGTILGFSKRDDSGKAEKGNLKDLEFDLHAFAKNDVILETNVAQAELRGDVRITGNGDRPQVAGKIEVVEGEFGLQSNRFEIVSGQMSFSPYRDSLDPQISLVGETSLLSRTGEQNQVRLLLSGSLLEPKVNFISDSGMRQEEVQALLGLGANVESLQSSKGKKARSFSQLINPVSGISIEDRLTALTGFSSVQIDTAFSSTSGEIVPRLSAKRPLTRKLELDLQTELSGNQASEASIDYPLTPYLSLIAGWRNTSAVGNAKKSSGSFDVGVLYRRAFPGHELLPPEVLGKWRGREAEESESPQVEQNP